MTGLLETENYLQSSMKQVYQHEGCRPRQKSLLLTGLLKF